MTPAGEGGLSRRERAGLAVFISAPFVVYLLFALLGFTKYLQYAALGGVAIALATALFLRPREALWILLVYVYIGPAVPFAAVAGPLAFLILAAVLYEMLRGEPNHVTDVLFWYATGFLILIALGSFVFARSYSSAISELGRYAKTLLVMLLIVQLVRTPHDLRRMMNMIFIGVILTVIVGAVNLLLGIQTLNASVIEGDTTASYMIRFSGAHPNANLAAALMCSSLPLGIFGVKHSSRGLRVLYVVGVVVVIAAMFATFSRSMVFPFTLVVIAMLVREARSRRAYISIGVLVALGLVLAPHAYWERVFGLRQAFESETLDWSVYLRLIAMRTAWELFQHHPFTGVGLGNFSDAAAYQLFVRIPAHNTFLEILVGLGIFGLLAYVLVILSGLRHSLAGARQRWSHHPSWMRSASFYWSLSAISICVSALFGNLMFRYYLWVPVAAGLVIGNLLREEKSSSL
ncbi:MAG TPA: O-antigen ligase family protein [Candidatus Krumholzibacteria bacterium]